MSTGELKKIGEFRSS